MLCWFDHPHIQQCPTLPNRGPAMLGAMLRWSGPGFIATSNNSRFFAEKYYGISRTLGHKQLCFHKLNFKFQYEKELYF